MELAPLVQKVFEWSVELLLSGDTAAEHGFYHLGQSWTVHEPPHCAVEVKKMACDFWHLNSPQEVISFLCQDRKV